MMPTSLLGFRIITDDIIDNIDRELIAIVQQEPALFPNFPPLCDCPGFSSVVRKGGDSKLL